MRKRDYLGSFELMVMLALMQRGENAYGVPNAREIASASHPSLPLHGARFGAFLHGPQCHRHAQASFVFKHIQTTFAATPLD
jgi:hypothetical protein